MSLTPNEPNDWNKWEIVYSWQDGGREYMSQAQYEDFMKAVNNKMENISFKDGRLLSTRILILRRNPNWIDQEKVAKIREGIIERDKKIKEKYEGEV